MGKTKYTVYGCICDKCHKAMFTHWGEQITSEVALKDAMNDEKWVEFVSGRVLCKQCYNEIFEEE